MDYNEKQIVAVLSCGCQVQDGIEAETQVLIWWRACHDHEGASSRSMLHELNEQYPQHKVGTDTIWAKEFLSNLNRVHMDSRDYEAEIRGK